MKRYDSYIDSGLEWVGEIPSGWRILKNKYFLNQEIEKSESGDEELLSVSEHNGIVPRKSIKTDGELSRSESLVGYLKVQKGHLVSNIMLTWKRGLGVSDFYGIVSPAYSVFSFSNSYPKYFHYLFRTDLYTTEFKKYSKGVIESRLRLYDDSFLRLFSHFPPLPVQQQIVSFLDSKTSQIDELIQKKERKIELLKEYRTSLINQVVTKGLNPNVEMKDSGVEWIGEIPSHWVLSKVMYVLEFHNNVRIPLSSEDRGKRQGEYRYYGSTGIIDYVDDYLFDGEYILIGEDGSNLRLRTYRLSNVVSGKFWVNNHSHILRSKDGNNHYYSHLLELTDFSNYITGSTQPKLTMDNLKIVPMICPPLSEQQQIVEYLDEQTKKIDSSIQIEERKIELLKEYRQSLISSVVTGKIDVRTN